MTRSHTGVISDTFLFEVAIVAAPFLPAWTAEAAEVDIGKHAAC